MKTMKKTGKEIMELYKEYKKAGLTPEEAMLYLAGHMEAVKAKEIGMDMKCSDGRKFMITLAIKIDGEENGDVELPSPKKSKYDVPGVA